jgi:hypothetical protein
VLAGKESKDCQQDMISVFQGFNTDAITCLDDYVTVCGFCQLSKNKHIIMYGEWLTSSGIVTAPPPAPTGVGAQGSEGCNPVV